jgi:hypothetical protein
LLSFFIPLHATKQVKIYHSPATYYFYLSAPFPRYLLDKMIKKGSRPALIYSIKTSKWLRENITALKKTTPLFFVDGTLSSVEKERLHELLKALHYNATIIHLLKNAQPLTFSPLFRSYHTISFNNNETILTHAKKKGKARYASQADKFDFRNSISVIKELSFPTLSYRFIADGALSNKQIREIKPTETVIFFFQKEKKLSDFLENW